MNICMVGLGMMGADHSEALADWDCCLHVLVGRRQEPTEAFARQFGYRKWTLDYAAALADPATDVVIIASPSESGSCRNTEKNAKTVVFHSAV